MNPENHQTSEHAQYEEHLRQQQHLAEQRRLEEQHLAQQQQPTQMDAASELRAMMANLMRLQQEAEERNLAAFQTLRAQLENLSQLPNTSVDPETPHQGAETAQQPHGAAAAATQNYPTAGPAAQTDWETRTTSLEERTQLPERESAPRPKEPDTFAGHRNKLNAFENQIRGMIRLCPRHFATQERQVRYALSFLRGDAQDWFEPRQLLWDRNPSACSEFQSLDAFFDTLRLHYGEIDETERASKAILQLKQTHSAAKFATDFQRYRAKLPDWSEATMVSLFFRGLKSQLKMALVAQGVVETRSLDTLINKAVKLDHQLYDLRLATPSTSDSSYHGPAPMEIGQLEGTRAPGRPHITDEERSYRQRNGICFGCGVKGHIARNCPKKEPKN